MKVNECWRDPLPWQFVCLLIMASRVAADAPLVVGANRDENLERSSTAVTVLKDCGPRVIGGRDEVAGGTWLAVNEHGVVAALTNRPAPEGRDPSKRSRGELPLALAQHESAARAVEDFALRFRPADYNRAWLMVGDRDTLFWIDMTGDRRPLVEELGAGTHILENMPLGARSSKVDHTRSLLGSAAACGADSDVLLHRLQHVLGDHSPPSELLSIEERPLERLASCVHSDNYGTRSSTVVRVPASPEARPIEILVAGGPPCAVPFQDVSYLWSEPPPGDVAE